MKINITSGDMLNEILQCKYPAETFVPFREAMIKGSYDSKLFSDEFIEERSKIHGVSAQEYLEKLGVFVDILKSAKKYEEIVLWFGEEPFCAENVKVVIQSLRESGFDGKLVYNVVDENDGNVLRTTTVSLA